MVSAGTARGGKASVLVLLCCLSACASELSMSVDLLHANARAPFQTAPETVVVIEADLVDPYDVLGDIQVMGRQRGAFGNKPTREEISREMQQRSARLGAHAVIMFSCGEMGSSLWSYNELRCHGRAVRFR